MECTGVKISTTLKQINGGSTTKHRKTVFKTLRGMKADVGANAWANSDLALVTSFCENVCMFHGLRSAR
jgi:hypothetical protein